jgi:hypothetical protein
MGSESIHALNDAFRKGERPEQVKHYERFTGDNEPHGEHDFWSFEHLGEKLFWKIDYYAKDLESWSENPANVSITTRVLTIMLAEEY